MEKGTFSAPSACRVCGSLFIKSFVEFALRWGFLLGGQVFCLLFALLCFALFCFALFCFGLVWFGLVWLFCLGGEGGSSYWGFMLKRHFLNASK